MSKTQAGSLRTRIVEKLAELQAKYGAPIVTDKGNMPEGQAREDYINWYLEQRASDIGVKHDLEFYKKWAIVHLADALKYRPDSVKSLGIQAAPPPAAAPATPTATPA